MELTKPLKYAESSHFAISSLLLILFIIFFKAEIKFKKAFNSRVVVIEIFSIY